MMNNNNTRIRKSVRLSKEEHSALTSAQKDFPTMVDFAEAVGVNRSTLLRVVDKGTACSETIKAIQLYLSNVEAAGA